ncbi:MAG: HAMP domain-containing sensor histidine kinase [Candidatus Hydrogenedentota bacterium]
MPSLVLPSATLAPMAAMLISALLASVALLQGNRSSRTFGLLALANALWCAGDVVHRAGQPAGIWIIYIGNLAVPPLLLLLAAVMTGGAFTSFFTTMLISFGLQSALVSLPAARLRLEQALAIYLAASLVYALYDLGRLSTCAESRITRLRLRVLILGVAVAGFGGLLNYANEFGWRIRETGAIFNAVGVGIIAAAALRYGIFDLGRITAIVLVDLTLGFLFCAWAFAGYSFAPRAHLPPLVLAAVFVMIGLPVAGRIRHAIASFFESLLLSEQVDGAALRIETFRDLTDALDSRAVHEALLRAVARIAHAPGAVYLPDEMRWRRVAGETGPDVVEDTPPSTAAYETDIPARLRKMAPRSGAWLRLGRGALLVMEKKSGRPFFASDRVLLADLAGMATLALTRIEETERRARAEEEAIAGKLSAGVAHDVLNPVGAIAGAAEMILKRNPDDEFAGIVKMEAARVERICRDFLEYGRPFPLEFRSCVLRPVLQRAAATMRADASCAGVEFTIAGDVILNADEDALYRLATNLFRNAVKAGSRIVDVSIAPGELLFDDDGPGIAPGEREHIWEPFRASRSGGTGLGLPLVRKIAEAHGGSVGVETSPQGGARFRIRLPEHQDPQKG